MEIGSAYPLEERMTMEIKGRHLIEGVPKTITITDEEIREALAETVNVIVDAVRVALERTPPELSADIVDRGIVLTGGGALLKNLDKRLREETGLPLAMAEDPLSSVVLGAGRCCRISTCCGRSRLTDVVLDGPKPGRDVMPVLEIDGAVTPFCSSRGRRPHHPDLGTGHFEVGHAPTPGGGLRAGRRSAARRLRRLTRHHLALERLRGPSPCPRREPAAATVAGGDAQLRLQQERALAQRSGEPNGCSTCEPRRAGDHGGRGDSRLGDP